MNSLNKSTWKKVFCKYTIWYLSLVSILFVDNIRKWRKRACAKTFTDFGKYRRTSWSSDCQNNWSSANTNPAVARSLIQQEVDNNFVEEIHDIDTAERRWTKGVALGKLGVACADNRDPRWVLDSTICGMNGCCSLPEKQRLPNLRHVSHFFSTCPPLQEQWQGASIDIEAARKRMLIKEDERGALPFQLGNKTYAYRSAYLVQKQMLGIGEEYLAHCSDSFTDSCTSDMQLGSMWTTSSFSSPTQQRQCSLLLRLFSPDSFERLYHGKSWNLAALFNGMDGPSDHHRWLGTFVPSKLRKYETSFPTYSNTLADKTLKRSLAFFSGRPPSFMMPDFYSLLFIATSSQFLPPSTAFANALGTFLGHSQWWRYHIQK